MFRNKKVFGVFLLVILFAAFCYCNDNKREKFTIDITEDENEEENIEESTDKKDDDTSIKKEETPIEKENGDSKETDEVEPMEDKKDDDTSIKKEETLIEKENGDSKETDEVEPTEDKKDNEEDESDQKKQNNELYQHINPQNHLSVEYAEKKFYLKKTGSFYSQETFESEFPSNDYYVVYTNEEGKRVKEEEVKNNIVINTIIKKYYDTGETHLRAEYGKNNIPKKVVVYYKNSYVKAEEFYIYGDLKLITIFNKQGQKIREERYSDGTIKSAVNYTKDVIIREEYYNNDGQAHGWWVYRTNNGVKIKEEHYENDEMKEYVLYRYNRRGEKISDEIYENGKLVEYFTYRYTDKYIIQERYALEKQKDKDVYVLMERIQFENK